MFIRVSKASSFRHQPHSHLEQLGLGFLTAPSSRQQESALDTICSAA